MAAEKKKHLRELLEDDQEPFHLNHYIADLRSQMGYSDLRVKKLKPQHEAVLPPGLFTCESSCFLATHHTNKSPLFELRSPPRKESSDGRVYLRIPARTAAILLEAAARIQKQQSEKANKTNNRARNRGKAFGLFGSVLKRLTNRIAKTRSYNADGNAVLSEPTSSIRRECLVEIGDKCFCESPFHFVLHATPSTSSHQTPHFTSTATYPARRSTEDEDSDETESLEKVRGQEEVDKEEKDKEQCSPVSVLDPVEKEEDHHQREVPDHLNLLSCSFEVVQRTKRRLLKKLCRFKKLGGMDPVHLERKMSEEQQEEEEKEKEKEESEEEDNMRIYDTDGEYEDVDEAMGRESGWVEEERRKKWRMMNALRVGMGAEEAADAVVQKDIRGEAGEWTRYGGEVEEAVTDIELSIFIFLIDEFSHELVSSCMNK